MCGRVIQSSGPLRYAIVDGMNVRDSRVHNYPPRWNAAPSQDLRVIRRNHQTGEVSLEPLRWGLIPYWCQDPNGGRRPINAKCETVRNLPTFRAAYRRRRCIVPVDGFASRLITIVGGPSRVVAHPSFPEGGSATGPCLQRARFGNACMCPYTCARAPNHKKKSTRQNRNR